MNRIAFGLMTPDGREPALPVRPFYGNEASAARIRPVLIQANMSREDASTYLNNVSTIIQKMVDQDFKPDL